MKQMNTFFFYKEYYENAKNFPLRLYTNNRSTKGGTDKIKNIYKSGHPGGRQNQELAYIGKVSYAFS